MSEIADKLTSRNDLHRLSQSDLGRCIQLGWSDKKELNKPTAEAFALLIRRVLK